MLVETIQNRCLVLVLSPSSPRMLENQKDMRVGSVHCQDAGTEQTRQLMIPWV